MMCYTKIFLSPFQAFLWLLSEMVLIGLADKADLCSLISKIIVGLVDKSKRHFYCLKYHLFTVISCRRGSRGVAALVQAVVPAGGVLQHSGGGAHEDGCPAAPPSSPGESLGHPTSNHRYCTV